MIIRSRQTDSSVSVDLTPIIDMVFLLLIFFLVATTFQQTEREMRIALPVASSAGPISVSLREIIINVDQEGRMIVVGRTVTPAELRTMITEAVKLNPQQKVTIRGDRNTRYEHVVVAFDICKASGVQQPYIDTTLER